MPEGLRQGLAEAPELLEPIEDPSVLESHRELLGNLMSAVFPPALWETDALAALVPFSLKPFHVSPEFRRKILDAHGAHRGSPHMSGEDYVTGRLKRAYYFILRELYGIREGLVDPLIQIVPDPETGLDRHYKLIPDFRFVEVRGNGAPDRLTDQDRTTILEHLAEPEVLRKILPPENFEFRGFTAVRAMDVTETEVLAALERDLIDRDSIFSQPGFLRLQQTLRSLFGKPEVVASLSAIQRDQVLMLQKGCDMTHSCIFAGSRHVPVSEFEGSIFERGAKGEGILMVRDLAEEPSRTWVDDEALAAGIRSFLIAPLHYQGELIGLLELGSPNPGELGPTDAQLLDKVLPVFSMSLKRALDELHNNVQGIIKEKCTAVHPSVEWRFEKTVYDHLESLHQGKPSELEAIVFRDVYPLYGASDIRGSSDGRNRGIQADLTEHLDLALDVVRAAADARSLPILDELGHRIRVNLEETQDGLRAGDELSAIHFLSNELEPVFPVLREFGPAVGSVIDAYEAALDRDLGTVYHKRKDFEGSVSLFNERLAVYLDGEEAEAQTIFPHYFNKHQTDGLDYLIYVGASMVENLAFDEIYVRNLRLWQIMVACGIAWHTEDLKSSLAVPLDATHLILLHSSPLSIRFRFDEKRFDVDGAYDVAHEIVRSRIDKAVVKGGTERLTQPEKIAIVYSRPEEAREMRQHVDFLQSEGYLTGDLEYLELGDLPGVQGLKAMRVRVDLESSALAERARRVVGM